MTIKIYDATVIWSPIYKMFTIYRDIILSLS